MKTHDILAVTLSLIAISFSAQAKPLSEEQESTTYSAHANVGLGGAYASNLFGNASEIDDTLGLAKLALDGKLFPSENALLGVSYSLDGELNRTWTEQNHFGHVGGLSAGYRFLDNMFGLLLAGMEQAIYPKNEWLSFLGLFGRAELRFEIGEASTLRATYGFRQDRFEYYDLDNRVHLAKLAWEQAIGDSLELKIPVSFEHTYYLERFLLDDVGANTSEHRTGKHWLAEPEIIYMPSYRLRVIGAASVDVNDSNDTYYYLGPFGTETPNVNPSLVPQYDSYTSGAFRGEIRYDMHDAITSKVLVKVGQRQFKERVAYDAFGMATGDKQKDTFASGALEMTWRVTNAVGLKLAYAYARQWSNDALWDYDAHRVEFWIDTWWGE